MLFYQDFKDTFVCNTQQLNDKAFAEKRCFIRISKILLYAIHNQTLGIDAETMLFYQDFKDTFVCNTQLYCLSPLEYLCCFIRISKILLYAIHNTIVTICARDCVVLSGFQRYFCMQYTTMIADLILFIVLFYQDFKDTFVCNTQPTRCHSLECVRCFIRISKILLYAIHNASS